MTTVTGSESTLLVSPKTSVTADGPPTFSPASYTRGDSRPEGCIFSAERDHSLGSGAPAYHSAKLLRTGRGFQPAETRHRMLRAAFAAARSPGPSGAASVIFPAPPRTRFSVFVIVPDRQRIIPFASPQGVGRELTAANDAIREPSQAYYRLHHEKTKGIPQAGPQSDGSQQGQNPKAERHGHPDPRPSRHARPVGDDGATRNEAGKQERQHEAQVRPEVHGNEQYQR
jgi:hypothetical protein